jgi:glycosyltransferase involved in cell wall biosynthesis
MSVHFEHPPIFSVIVPAYNEEAGLAASVEEIYGVFEQLGQSFEIIVVDDGSTDGTGILLKTLSDRYPEIKTVMLSQNSGKGHAIKKGVMASGGRYIVFLDADLDIHPAQFGNIFKALEKNGCDVAIGSKRHPESIVAYPRARRIISTIYYWIIKLLLGLNVRDTQAGFKIYRREVLTSILPRILVKKFAFDLEMLVAANRLGFAIEEFPIQVVFSRPFGRITIRDCWHAGIDTLAIFYRSRILDFYCPPAYWEKPDVKVSIIVPFRTPGKTLERCLATCLAQDYENYEIILLPDKVTQGLHLIAGGDRVSVVPTGAVNPSVKRNMGAAKASGRILAFLDDDAFSEFDWLSSAAKNFADETVAAVGGPAVTPEGSPLLERAGGNVYASRAVSGAYRSRYVPHRFQDVDDYPSCNLFVSKDVFFQVGGFSSQHWPGEDTLLCRAIILETGKRIVYDPHVVVAHQRRPLFGKHLAQIARYALHRGYFVKRWPENSLKPAYFIPSLWVVFCLLGPLAWQIPYAKLLYFTCGGLYLALTFLFSIRLPRPVETLLTFAGSIATHFTYGLFFLRGLLTPVLSVHKPISEAAFRGSVEEQHGSSGSAGLIQKHFGRAPEDS